MSEPTTETIKEPMHPSRLEKNANIIFRSALRPQVVSDAASRRHAMTEITVRGLPWFCSNAVVQSFAYSTGFRLPSLVLAKFLMTGTANSSITFAVLALSFIENSVFSRQLRE
jgi:hypothetical protein